MLKGVYSFKNLDLDIAQAYIAIVLDYHSQYKAAERVLNFYKYVSSDENEVTVISWVSRFSQETKEVFFSHSNSWYVQ